MECEIFLKKSSTLLIVERFLLADLILTET